MAHAPALADRARSLTRPSLQYSEYTSSVLSAQALRGPLRHLSRINSIDVAPSLRVLSAVRSAAAYPHAAPSSPFCVITVCCSRLLASELWQPRALGGSLLKLALTSLATHCGTGCSQPRPSLRHVCVRRPMAIADAEILRVSTEEVEQSASPPPPPTRRSPSPLYELSKLCDD